MTAIRNPFSGVVFAAWLLPCSLALASCRAGQDDPPDLAYREAPEVCSSVSSGVIDELFAADVEEDVTATAAQLRGCQWIGSAESDSAGPGRASSPSTRVLYIDVRAFTITDFDTLTEQVETELATDRAEAEGRTEPATAFGPGAFWARTEQDVVYSGVTRLSFRVENLLIQISYLRPANENTPDPEDLPEEDARQDIGLVARDLQRHLG